MNEHKLLNISSLSIIWKGEGPELSGPKKKVLGDKPVWKPGEPLRISVDKTELDGPSSWLNIRQLGMNLWQISSSNHCSVYRQGCSMGRGSAESMAPEALFQRVLPGQREKDATARSPLHACPPHIALPTYASRAEWGACNRHAPFQSVQLKTCSAAVHRRKSVLTKNVADIHHGF